MLLHPGNAWRLIPGTSSVSQRVETSLYRIAPLTSLTLNLLFWSFYFIWQKCNSCESLRLRLFLTHNERAYLHSDAGLYVEPQTERQQCMFVCASEKTWENLSRLERKVEFRRRTERPTEDTITILTSYVKIWQKPASVEVRAKRDYVKINTAHQYCLHHEDVKNS